MANRKKWCCAALVLNLAGSVWLFFLAASAGPAKDAAGNPYLTANGEPLAMVTPHASAALIGWGLIVAGFCIQLGLELWLQSGPASRSTDSRRSRYGPPDILRRDG